MICGHPIPHHLNADDSQLYVSFASGNSTVVLSALQSCLAFAQSWMSMNKLKLNPDKSEFLLIGNEQQQSNYLSMFLLRFCGVKTNPTRSAWNLGVLFDKNVFLTHTYTYAVCSSCFYHVWELWHIRCYVDLDSAKLLATALVSSRFDYCNSLLYGIADTDLTKLQCIHNRLAHVVTKSLPFTHSVSLLSSLHWLPVKFGNIFQISLLTYKIFHGKQPVYLHSMLATSLPSRSLRSNKGISLLVPRAKTNTSARAFQSCTPSLWNSLPLCVRSAISVATFKKYLKTHLFDFSFIPYTRTPDGSLMLRNYFHLFCC